MYNVKELKVKKIINASGQKMELELEDGSLAIAYTQFTPEIKEEDTVVVNTTAVDLELGSGGYHFVLYNLDAENKKGSPDGHIMKLRYTPLQFSTLAVESQESEYHKVLSDKLSIEGMPIIIGSLHSQLAAAVATAKHLNPQINIAYIMTDGASLSIGLSDTVKELKEKKLIDSTITFGQAFGGDFEAVNIYSALISAKYVAKADLAIVAMGPGVSGTSTLLGNTAVEVGSLINAVNSLDGKPIVIARLSFKDKRFRHQGISHHTVTALKQIALSEALVPLPQMEKKKRNFVEKQIQLGGLDKKHTLNFLNNEVTEKALTDNKLTPTTMGRSVKEEREFFLACGCAAISALDLIKKGNEV
ncbi:MAG: DUF3866 family protein [Actinobacteria bacterium]|nr:MAG: DUF3866 family protein [Actinomycetota bacterium]